MEEGDRYITDEEFDEILEEILADPNVQAILKALEPHDTGGHVCGRDC